MSFWVGESGVGKSSVAERYGVCHVCLVYCSDALLPAIPAVKNEFPDDGYQPSTIGVTFMTRTLELSDCVMKFEIWDTAGRSLHWRLTSPDSGS
jgi:hypothetical protein